MTGSGRHSPSGRKLTKSEQMARVRSRDTAAEITLRRALWARGLRFRLRPRLPGTPDIAFPSSRVAILVDGCFWHGCAEHYTAPATNAVFWKEKLVRNRSRDARVDDALRREGWLPVRVWEHELRDLDRVVRRLEILIRARRETLG